MRDLYVDNGNVEIFDDADEPTRHFVAAVRASAMTSVRFARMRALPENIVEVAALINARQQ